MFKGSMVALVTPFNEENNVNFEVLDQLVDFHLAHNTDALVILGTSGESSCLTFEEEAEIVKFVVKKVNKQIPIIVGAGSNNTKEAVWQGQRFEQMGADGLLFITPYYNKTSEEGMYQHFKMINDALHTPIIMYNVPGRTGCGISINNIARLKKLENIVGLKEASGDISYLVKASQFIDDSFSLYSGNDDMIVPAMSMGAMGVISVFANCYPDETHKLVNSYLSGDISTAASLQKEYLEVINNLFLEVNPIPVKAALCHMGFNVGLGRMPLVDMSNENKKILFESMEKKGYLVCK